MPPANPHNRKSGPAEEEEEDLVDKLIRNTGCEKEHYLVQVKIGPQVYLTWRETDPRYLGLITMFETGIENVCWVMTPFYRYTPNLEG